MCIEGQICCLSFKRLIFWTTVSNDSDVSAIITIVKNRSRLFLFIQAVSLLVAILLILATPSESQRALLFGLSPVRLLSAAILFLLLIGCLWLARSSSCSLDSRSVGIVALLAGWLTVVTLVFFASPFARGVNFSAIFTRLTPFLSVMGVFSLSYILFSAWARFEDGRCPVLSLGAVVSGAMVGLLLIGVRLFSLESGVGLTILSGTFYRQGVSLTEVPWLVPIALVSLLMILGAGLTIGTKFGEALRAYRAWAETVVFWLIWLTAACVWLRVPFEGRSYFAPGLRPPNYNFYPSSDAENYDLLALNLFTGNGFRNGMTVVRPLYIAFLAFLHQFAGVDYLRMTGLQIIVLALIPALLFKIGCRLRLSWGGLLAAIWFIGREAISIRLTPTVHVSNSRLFMSELPMALLICWLTDAWLAWATAKDEAGSLRAAFFAGLAGGMGFLVRTQSIVIPAAIAFFMLVSLIWRCFQGESIDTVRRALRPVCVFVIVLLVVIVPWLAYTAAFPNETVRADRSEGAYLNRLYTRAAGLDDTLVSSPLAALQANPTAVFGEIGGHLVNNVISSVLIFPLRTEAVRDPSQWIFDAGNFWYRESHRDVLTIHGAAWTIWAVIFAFGMAGAWVRCRWASWIPFIVYGAYTLGCSLAMNSGFRFLLPVDWFALLLFGMGIETIVRGIITAVLGPAKRSESQPVMKRLSKHLSMRMILVRRVAAIGLAIFIGGLLPCLDGIGRFRGSITTEPADFYETWLGLRDENRVLGDLVDLDAALISGELEFVRGLAVYPRAYPALEGDADGVSSVKRFADYPRMVWMVLTEDGRVLTASLPMTCRESFEKLADPADVLLLGRETGDSFTTLAIDTLAPVNGGYHFSAPAEYQAVIERFEQEHAHDGEMP